MPSVPSEAAVLAFIFLLLHRAQASCDRRSLLGSDGSSFESFFLRFLDG
jgi:hypothetical protein